MPTVSSAILLSFVGSVGGGRKSGGQTDKKIKNDEERFVDRD